MNNNSIINKNINYFGYHIKIPVNNKYICCFIETDIYKYIKTLVPLNKKQHIVFLELYQNNLLNCILSFLYKYPSDVIRRINSSLKVISREILNIYHLTRKKQNSNLYDILPNVYKKILFNLHTIYVSNKHSDYLIISNDDFKDKISITIDIVYNYLKNTKIINIVDIFCERKILINNLTLINFNIDNLIYSDDIDVLTQTELMFN